VRHAEVIMGEWGFGTFYCRLDWT